MKRDKKRSDAARSRPLGREGYEAIFRFSLDAVMLTVPNGRVLAANPAACEMLRLDEDEIIRRGRLGIADPSDDRWAVAIATRERLGHNRSELSFLRGDGTTFVADVASNAFTDENGELRTCVVFHDITEHLDEIERQVRLVEEFRGLSLVDELTGIRNRRGLMSGAEALLAIADRNHQSVQALFIDVDDLKELNDLHGHQAGDEALVAVARALHDSVRAADLVARIGGDEFVVLVLDADDPFAEVVIRRIVATIERTALPGAKPLSVSVGRASRKPGSARPVEDLLAEADMVMYASRAERRRRETGQP